MARKATARIKANKKTLIQNITITTRIPLQKQVVGSHVIVHEKQEKNYKPNQLVEREYTKTTTKQIIHRPSNWIDRIATATISRIKAGLEERQMFTYVGRLKGLNKGSYTRNKLTGLMNR